ncbi:MAG: L-threonylcarbamoyladenylate synthase [Ignavibacteria bacterium]|jgi:L-threonylcarbamoyladenylate synthase
MYTKIVNDVEEAAKYILNSEVVAFPTETVYGLGANVFDDEAVKKIFILKKRPLDNPLIVHISSKKQIGLLAAEIGSTAKKIIKKFFPGPITVILKKNPIVPDRAAAVLDTIAIRMPSSKIAHEFIKACGVPIAAPSANLSGSPSPTSFLHVLHDFNGRVPCVLAGPSSKYGLESTVIDCSASVPAVLRPGMVTLEQLRKIDRKIILRTHTRKMKSPGQKYKHYSPEAKVVLVKKLSKVVENSAYIGIASLDTNSKTKISFYKVCRDVEHYAKSLFSFFRECDVRGIHTLYAQKVDESGLGLAIMNRLKKAAKE